MKNKIIISLLFALALGSLLRLYKLGDVPTGLHRDEAFLGYNAYSLLKTGKDMTGNILPVHFESFLYSPGGYSYLSIPFLFLFDPSAFSIRLASASFGILTIFLMYILVIALFPSFRYKRGLGIIASILLAVTPWHVNLSRTATENIPVIFFTCLGIVFYIKAGETKKILLTVLSFLSFSITIALYQGPRAFLPIFVFGLIYFFNTPSQKNYNVKLSFVFYAVFIILPIIFILINPLLSTRINTVSIFSSDKTKLIVEEQIREDGTKNVSPIRSRLLHNKPIEFGFQFLNNYFAHFSYQFLFTDQAKPDRYRVPGVGILYISFIPIIFYGYVVIFRKFPRQAFFLSFWIACSFVGSALTYDDIPNVQRTIIALPPLILIAAFGLLQLFLRKDKMSRILLSIIIVVFLFETNRYAHHYFIQQVVHVPIYRQEGYKELVADVNDIINKDSALKAIITNRESAPAIFFLFFGKYDPKKYIEETHSSVLRDFDRVNFGTYVFSQEQCPFPENLSSTESGKLCPGEKNTIYVNSGLCSLPKNCANILKEIKRSDGSRVFTLVEKIETNHD